MEAMRRYGVTITKPELAALPIIRYQGTIVTIENEEEVMEAITKLKESDIIGFDTETRPNFRKGQFHNVALVQLATRKQCFLFRLSKIGFPDMLRDLLEDEKVLKVGLSLHDDFHNLNRLRPIHPKGFIDLQQYVKRYGIVDNSLSKIYGILFGHRISKSKQLTNWEAPFLTEGQKMYASLDAKACINIYDKLASGAFSPTESPYYRPIDD